jgi:hypothetical protein
MTLRKHTNVLTSHRKSKGGRMSFGNPQFSYDPVFLAKVHELFRVCWAEAEKFATDLDSYRQSSLKRTIASRLLREAHTRDDESLVNRVLDGILP